MRRRTLLATTGTLLTAGCSEILPPPQTTVEGTASETPPDDGTPTDTVPTEPPTTEQTTTEPPTTEQTTTERETDTPTQRERENAQVIDTVQGHLSDALSTYLGYAEGTDPTLLAVTAGTSVDTSPVTKSVEKARQTLDQTTDGASQSQRDTIDRLRGIATLLSSGIRCQWNLHQAYDEVTFAVDRIYAEQHTQVSTSDLRSPYEAANSHFETIQAETQPGDATALEGLTEAVIADKIAQFETELSAFDTLPEVLVNISDGLDGYQAPAESFIDEQYSGARRGFETAIEIFRPARSKLTAIDRPASLEPTISELVSVTDALVTGTEDFIAACEAATDFDWEERDAATESAIEHFEESQIVAEEIDTTSRLVEFA